MIFIQTLFTHGPQVTSYLLICRETLPGHSLKITKELSDKAFSASNYHRAIFTVFIL